MHISYNWLKDYVALNMPPEKLAEMLTMSGTEVTSFEKKGGDYLMELEVTSNRPDCLSVLGVAREVAALTGKKLIPPKYAVPKSKKTVSDTPSLSVEDKRRCLRYSARVIQGVKVAPSPKWLADKLISMGVRPVNNVVDITNFCLIELGEPMHAFDYDKLLGKRIVVRSARAKEKIVTIDGVERELDPSILVIADERNPVAVAGIMGGVATEVTASTKNILLEAAIFDPVSIRRSSRKLRLSSESSYRFERRIDPEIVAAASDRAARLIVELAGGRAGPLIDRSRRPEEQRIVELRYAKVNNVLGVYNKPSVIRAMLSRLGFKGKSSLPKTLKVIVPRFRSDIETEVDLIEEIARVYGYQRLPVSIPKIVEQPVRISSRMHIERILRDLLLALGLNEIITYSLISRRLLSMSSLENEPLVDIRNPMSAEQEVMRPSLLPGILNAVLTNVNKGNKNLSFFELGNIYKHIDNAPGHEEIPYLGIAITGEVPARWKSERRAVTFFDIKGIVETFCERLAVEDVLFADAPLSFLAPGLSAAITIRGETVGSIGRVAHPLIEAFDIKQNVFFVQLSFAALARFVRLDRMYVKPPQYPSVTRDISLIIDKTILHSSIVAAVREEGQGLVKEVSPFDQYSGAQIPAGKKSVTYRIEYQDLTRTLEDTHVNAVHGRICDKLVKGLGASLR